MKERRSWIWNIEVFWWYRTEEKMDYLLLMRVGLSLEAEMIIFRHFWVVDLSLSACFR